MVVTHVPWARPGSKCTYLFEDLRVAGRALAAEEGSDQHAMWAVRKNSTDLTTEQRTSLGNIAATNAALFRAYLLKEQLREVFQGKGRRRHQLLAGWLSWASNARIREFVALARTSRRYKTLIDNTSTTP